MMILLFLTDFEKFFSAVAVAFDVQKFQFAKTLLEKQPTASKLVVGVTDDAGNLLHAFSESCKDPWSMDQELIVELVSKAPPQPRADDISCALKTLLSWWLSLLTSRKERVTTTLFSVHACRLAAASPSNLGYLLVFAPLQAWPL